MQARKKEPPRPRSLNPRVDRDLEIICLHCLNKAPQRRYASAARLAEDLERYLAGEPIQARPAGTVERVAKWARRRPAAAALLVVSLLAVAALTLGGWWTNLRLQAALGEAEHERKVAESRRQEAVTQQKLAEQRRQEAETQKQEAEKQKLLAQEQRQK